MRAGISATPVWLDEWTALAHRVYGQYGGSKTEQYRSLMHNKVTSCQPR
jgi:hypothetical protein